MAEEVMLAPNCSAAAAAVAAVNTMSSLPLKRKRSGSPADAPVAQKLRTEVNVYNVSSQPTPSPSCPPSDSIASPTQSTMPTTPTRPPAPAASPTVEVDRLRDNLTAQLSLEVLLKHNELRLIDQEIAKCQVALEQLRRCTEIPYPGSHVTGISPDVSSGTGASVMVPGNGPPPMSPAPWGVTDGPYSRHYARWLLPDPRFDGGETEFGMPGTPGSGYPLVEGRSTRGNPMDFSALAGNTRPQRGVNGSRLQSLPSGYPIVKEKAGPMLIRRKSDQLLVKLVCLDCKRDNFSSTQGFINHCRIAHNRNFASHEAAAVASGEPVELDSSGAVISTRSESTVSVSTPGYVHPLIHAQLPTSSAMNPPVRESMSPSKPSINTSPSAMSTPRGSVSGHRRRPDSVKANPAFTASPATPHLSALMRERGLGLNLDKLVEEARTPVDLTCLSDGEFDFDGPTRSATKTPQEFAGQQGPRAARQPMRMPTAQAAMDRTESRKVLQLPEEMTPTRSQSHHSTSYLPHLSSLPSASQTCSPMNTPHDVIDHPAHLSPNTIESNQAPSLVSDDEDDYEAASDSDSPDSSEAGDDEEEFRHIEVQDDERSTAPSAPTESKPGPSLKTSMPQTTPPLPKSMKQGRPNHLPTMPSFNDRSRDEQPFNPMLDHLPPLPKPAKHGPVNFYHSSEDPSKKNRENGRKPSP
ncbi:hypothetical protein N7540_000407 [Penicillium herquei]|nr:hypothetical protein N7540_000407 [Penicillium herquei]